MPQMKRSPITCCQGCKSRIVEPNCHSYCPTYLAQKDARDRENAAARQHAAVQAGISDQRWSHYWRKLKEK